MKNIILMFFTAMYHLPVYLPSLYRRKWWLTNVPQTTKIPNCRSSWGFWVRYKGLPGCLSAYELCVYCSCCTNTLSHLRLSQGMSQTAGNLNLIPAVLDCSLWCSHKRRKSTDIIVICKKGFYIVGVNTVLVIKNNLNYPIYFATRLVLYHFRGQIMWCSSACINMSQKTDAYRAFLLLSGHESPPPIRNLNVL